MSAADHETALREAILGAFSLVTDDLDKIDETLAHLDALVGLLRQTAQERDGYRSAEQSWRETANYNIGRREVAEQARDEWRGLVEKVGAVDALRGLIAAAEPLCGKLEVTPGRAKLPPEYYPAAMPTIQVLREAVEAARAALDDRQTEADG